MADTETPNRRIVRRVVVEVHHTFTPAQGDGVRDARSSRRRLDEDFDRRVKRSMERILRGEA